jgi:hypothetical protein
VDLEGEIGLAAASSCFVSGWTSPSSLIQSTPMELASSSSPSSLK